MMEKYVISIKDLFCIREGKEIVRNVSLEVKKGEVACILGLNGAGKTTLMSSLLGLQSFEEGSVFVLGNDVAKKSSINAIVYLPESFMPSPLLTGFEFLYAFVDHLSKSYVMNVSSNLALDPSCLDRKIGSYSKGMVQKLGLLSIFVSDSKLVVMDEPMSGLDPDAKNRFAQLLLAHKNPSRAMLISSHSVNNIAFVCDKIFIMHNGTIIFADSPSVLISKHSSLSIEKAFLAEIAINTI